MSEPLSSRRSDSVAHAPVRSRPEQAEARNVRSAVALPIPGLSSGSGAVPGSSVVRRTHGEPRKARLASKYNEDPSKRRHISKNTRGGSRKVNPRGTAASGQVVVPKFGAQGREIWSGDRRKLAFFDNVKKAMAARRGVGCEIDGPSCRGTADAIDHVKDFATEKTAVAAYVYCDGVLHWKVSYRDEAEVEYNGGNDPHAGSVDLSNFQWACTSCNSSKGGRKGVDAEGAALIGKCPGGESCNDDEMIG